MPVGGGQARLRILTVSHFYEAHGGGIERVAGQLCRQFGRLGETPVWAASDGDAPPDDGIGSVPLPCVNPIEKLTGLPMPIPGVRGCRALAAAVRQSDLVIIHDALYVTSILAMLLAKRYRKPAILVQHIASIPFRSALFKTLMDLANKIVTRPMLHSADARIFISDTVRHELLGTPPRLPYELLFNGVDKSIFNTRGSSLLKVLNGIAEGDSRRRMLFVGRYVEKKGLSVLRSLAASRPDLNFVLAGTGPIRPSEWGLTNVHDIGPQSPENLANIYRWADLLILPSVGEGYPLVIQEAMACGVPVVCGTPTDRADPDAGEWLRGVEIDLSRSDESAQRCSAAIDDSRLSHEERLKMSRYALRRYDWPMMAQRLITIGESL